jgi:HSP20 family protein
MMDKEEMVRNEKTSPAARAGNALPQAAAETVYEPDVDVLEDRDAIRIVADMPGVEQEGVDVSFENGVLRIEGRSRVEAPAGYEPVVREYGLGTFRRTFAVSEAVNVDGIKARIRHGVLEVTLPKREQVKARRIAIES